VKQNPNAKTPHLTLVGAGPGDPELISVKGIKALAEADVVLYDALVDKELLNYAPDRASKIFVGKKAGKHRFSQDEINRKIVKYAFQLGRVVRLKGGDPFVFGRGHEEITHAKAFGIPTAIVPGISSVNAVPALQEIPLTKRGVNESFWVITGTTSNGELSGDIELAAQSTATVVILMGLRKIQQIADVFKAHKNRETPVAVIQNGTWAEEKIALGTLENIPELVTTEKIQSPALIVIGEVVGLHPEFNYQILEPYLQGEKYF